MFQKWLKITCALQSCHTKLRDLFSEKLHVIGLAALVIAVIMVRMYTHAQLQTCTKNNSSPLPKFPCVCNFSLLHVQVFEMIFTMVLCCAIRNAPAY